jgi:hypothetical protein
VEYKVPTQVAYTTSHKFPTAWGFIDQPNRTHTVKKYLNLYLDPSILPEPWDLDEDIMIEDVRMCFTDIL